MCRMVKVFFIPFSSAIAGGAPVRVIAPTARLRRPRLRDVRVLRLTLT